MIIHSKFRDYYDHVQAFGVDETLRFVRIQHETFDSKKSAKYFNYLTNFIGRPKGWWITDEYINTPNYWRLDVEFVTNFGYVAFCGTIFPYIKIEDQRKKLHELQLSYPSVFCFTYEQYNTIATGNRLTKWYKKSKYKDHSVLRERAFNPIPTQFNIDEKCPIISSVLYAENIPKGETLASKLVYNPFLKDIEFVKIKDAYTAYVELDMYISGVLGRSVFPMVELSDEDKLYKQGFDPKYGFRTRPKELQ